MNVEFWQVEVSALDLSLLKMGPTVCSASECDREASKMRSPWPALGRSRSGGKKYAYVFRRLGTALTVAEFDIKLSLK